MDNREKQVQVEETQKSFCCLLFKDDWNELSDEKNLENVFKDINTLGIYWHVPYQIITKCIYNMDAITDTDYEKLRNSIIDRFNNADNVPKNLKEDTLRHIDLAIIQKEYINKNLKIANNELEEINDTKSKIYTDFITILGIFTAITFAIFGGLQLIGNTLDNLSNSMSCFKIGGSLIIASVILLATYLILMALVVSLSKLLSRDKDKRYKFTAKITLCIVLAIIGLFLIGCLFIFK